MRIRKMILWMLAVFVCLGVPGCNTADSAAIAEPDAGAVVFVQETAENTEPVPPPGGEDANAELLKSDEQEQNEPEEKQMRMMINGAAVEVTWENNESVQALGELAREGMTIQMSMYGGFEQVGSIGKSLPRNDVQMRTGPGDIVLYSGDQIVVFYGSNSWAYTKLGHVELSESEMRELLSNGDAAITLYTEP